MKRGASWPYQRSGSAVTHSVIPSGALRTGVTPTLLIRPGIGQVLGVW